MKRHARATAAARMLVARDATVDACIAVRMWRTRSVSGGWGRGLRSRRASSLAADSAHRSNALTDSDVVVRSWMRRGGTAATNCVATTQSVASPGRNTSKRAPLPARANRLASIGWPCQRSDVPCDADSTRQSSMGGALPRMTTDLPACMRMTRIDGITAIDVQPARRLGSSGISSTSHPSKQVCSCSRSSW